MRKTNFSVWALAAATLLCVACEKDDIDTLSDVVTIDFEEAVLGKLTLAGYNPASYENVLTGKHLAALCDDASHQLNGCMLFDEVLYRENGAGFGSFFSDFSMVWGGVFETTYAFSISSNSNMEVGTVHNQYSVYSTTNGANKFAIGYDGNWYSPTFQQRYGNYDKPTIVFEEEVEPVSVSVANSTYTYLQIMQNDPKCCYAVKALGYRGGEQVSELSITLADKGTIVKNWSTVSLQGLGSVDKIVFTVDWAKTSSEVQSPEMWCPFTFCIDNLKVEKQ